MRGGATARAHQIGIERLACNSLVHSVATHSFMQSIAAHDLKPLLAAQ
jgi:hypothetical protein